MWSALCSLSQKYFFLIQSNTGKICDCDLRKKVGSILSEKKRTSLFNVLIYIMISIFVSINITISYYSKSLFFSLYETSIFLKLSIYFTARLYFLKKLFSGGIQIRISALYLFAFNSTWFEHKNNQWSNIYGSYALRYQLIPEIHPTGKWFQ